MNTMQEKAVRDEISRCKDELYRYQMEKQAAGDADVYGLRYRIAVLIAKIEKLEEGLR